MNWKFEKLLNYFFVLVCFFPLISKSQQTCDLRDYYKDFIEVRKIKSKDKYFLIHQVVPINQNNCVFQILSIAIRYLSVI